MTETTSIHHTTRNLPRSCEQRIDHALEGRLAEFIPDVSSWSSEECFRYLDGEEWKVADQGDIDSLRAEVVNAMQARNSENLLGLECLRTYKLCLSWGGPADYFELNWSQQCSEWVGGRYLYQDWFDSAQRTLSSAQAEQLTEAFNIQPQYD